MKNVLFLAPVEGNGGIVSWARNYLNNYHSTDFKLINVGVSRRRAKIKEASFFRRVFDGLLDMYYAYKDVQSVIKKEKIDILHATTSGSLGTLRDYFIVRLCKRYGVKAIMHCHYGCISSDYSTKNPLGWLLRHTMNLYDQIWVLDSKSEKFLKDNAGNKIQVHIAPNFIDSPNECNISPKSYKKVAFVGNLIPTKGLFETVKAVASLENDTTLFIAGPGTDSVINTIKEIAGYKLDKNIHLLGCLPNNKAVELINSVDIISLPSYYIWEAFPISILEAMSRGKIVISTNRAAIPDMLTAIDGSKCGMLVEEKSVDSVKEAIQWCQAHTEDADILCQKAYEKVCKCYSSKIVFKRYTELYKML